MHTRIFAVLMIISFEAAWLAACEPATSTAGGVLEQVSDPSEVQEEAAEMALLRFLNHPWTSWRVLAKNVGLPASIAYAIVAHRDGADLLPETFDDNSFDDLEELRAVPGIDQQTPTYLLSWAARSGWLPGQDPWIGEYDGVDFRLSEAELTLATVNSAPKEILDASTGLYISAVSSIVAARPIDSLETLAELKHVGPSSLAKLKAYALSLTTVDAAPCPLAPVMTAADAAAVDFAAGEYTVCTPAPEDGVCPSTPQGLDTIELVEASVGRPLWEDWCSWEATTTCGAFRLGAGSCCFVVDVDRSCADQ